MNYPLNEPLLNLVDYFCWTVQRVFEKGETRYYERLKDKISVVVDLYDESKYLDWGNYYNVKNPLTSKNKKNPSSYYSLIGKRHEVGVRNVTDLLLI